MRFYVTEAAVRNGCVFKRLFFTIVAESELRAFLSSYSEPHSNWARDYFIIRDGTIVDGRLVDLLVRWDKVNTN